MLIHYYVVSNIWSQLSPLTAGLPVGAQLRELRPHEVATGAKTISIGMRDNPIHAAVWPDTEIRERALCETFAAGMARAGRTALCALADGEVVGVAGVATGGSCRPSSSQSAALSDRLARLDTGSVQRWRRWRSAWSAHDPDRRHWHLGPFAVAPEHRARGLGRGLLAYYCRGLDEARTSGYLEVDNPDNVGLYERFGFAVIGEETVLGVGCWFMLRPVC